MQKSREHEKVRERATKHTQMGERADVFVFWLIMVAIQPDGFLQENLHYPQRRSLSLSFSVQMYISFSQSPGGLHSCERQAMADTSNQGTTATTRVPVQ